MLLTCWLMLIVHVVVIGRGCDSDTTRIAFSKHEFSAPQLSRVENSTSLFGPFVSVCSHRRSISAAILWARERTSVLAVLELSETFFQVPSNSGWQAAVAGGSSILRFVAPEFASDKVTQWLSHSNTNAMTLTPWGELYIKLLANRTCLCSWSENILHVIHLFRYFYCSFLTANVNSVLVCSHAGYGEYGQTYYIYVLNRIK